MKHDDQVLALLKTQIANPNEVDDVAKTAAEVINKCAKPRSGGREETNGLIYGLIQSGKTGVITVTAAKGADEGYHTILILTSDIDPLYEQTLGRIQEALPGIDIINKRDFKDVNSFLQRINDGKCAIVTTKNAGLLGTLIENLKKGNVRGLSCLIIDDEADQASLNTRTSRDDGTRSAINDKIDELRSFFVKNTYVQVTATPQALFLQTPGHSFRPRFTVLSKSGADHVGGDDFFSDASNLVREFDLNDISLLTAGGQPSPTLEIPKSLLAALDTFMVGATFKRINEPDQNCAFLCHVSTRREDHNHIVRLLRKYKTDLTKGVKTNNQAVISRLKLAFDDLSSSHEGLKRADLNKLIEAIGFFSPGISVKLVNGETDEDVAVRSPYNLFVGGNKLGRGVTIKNLLVSYYGRNPRRPQADTVLQHARMYGYRRRDIGLLRLFLPTELHIVYKAITKMEKGLRDLIARRPSEDFRGVYLERLLSPTRRNILAPGSIGVYSGGSIYNPSQVMRNDSARASTEKIDGLLSLVTNKQYKEFSIEDIQKVISLVVPDPSQAERVWDSDAVAESVKQFAKLHNHKTGYIYVDRDRGLKERRNETQGILTGGEAHIVPSDKITLFILKTSPDRYSLAAWWPQIRFPDGAYAFAFTL